LDILSLFMVGKQATDSQGLSFGAYLLPLIQTGRRSNWTNRAVEKTETSRTAR
jgi:hypothetical protein